jgi:GNAT superfamily N-acetyltransferase
VSGWSVRGVVPGDQPALERIAYAGLDTYAEFARGWTRPKSFDEHNAQRLAEMIPDPMFFGLIAEVGGEPIAHVTLWQAHTPDEPPVPIPGLGHLAQIFVLREWWGSGVAKELLDAAVSEGRRRRYERIRLFTPAGQARARRFYEREGWRPTGKRQVGRDLGLEIVEYAIDL